MTLRDRKQLKWLVDAGVGVLDVEPIDYDDCYFKTYFELQKTPMGKELIRRRLAFVAEHADAEELPHLVDIGIGAGGFLEAAHQAGLRVLGFDVNPRGCEWLREKGWSIPDDGSQMPTKLSFPARDFEADVLTFWDVLEHIAEPWRYLTVGISWIFLTVPIFTGPDDARHSKHYKPGEHIWYWTEAGLLQWFRQFGYVCREISGFERGLGRESVSTFAFEKLDDGIEIVIPESHRPYSLPHRS